MSLLKNRRKFSMNIKGLSKKSRKKKKQRKNNEHFTYYSLLLNENKKF